MMIERVPRAAAMQPRRNGPISTDYRVARFARSAQLDQLADRLERIGFLDLNSNVRDAHSNMPGRRPLIRLVGPRDSDDRPKQLVDISRYYQSIAPSLRYDLEVEFDDVRTQILKKGHAVIKLIPSAPDSERIYDEAEKGFQTLRQFGHLATGATCQPPEMEYVYVSNHHSIDHVATLEAAIRETFPLPVTLVKPLLPGSPAQ